MQKKIYKIMNEECAKIHNVSNKDLELRLSAITK